MNENMIRLACEEMREKAFRIRSMTLDLCCRVGSGHITSGFSCTELLVALYYGDVLQYDPSRPEWDGRDRFILSKGHSSTALYPILADLGFFSEAELEKCCQPGALLGLLLKGDVPGVEMPSGSLGIGLGVSAGIAHALKLDGKTPLVFCMLGDGELHEGNVWESAMFASHYGLDNLVAIVDRNGLCCTDFTEHAMRLEPLEEKWEAFGWEARRIDGHDLADVTGSLRDVRDRRNGKPLAIIADTVKGKGVDFISSVPLMHGVALHGDDIGRARECLRRGFEDHA